jgi:hypothetical protein
MLFPYCGPLTAARLVGHCRLTKILKELHKSCQGEDGADDHKKGTQLLEVRCSSTQSKLNAVLRYWSRVRCSELR